MQNYTPITELPGTLLNAEQMARIRQRYWLAEQHAKGRRVLEVACGAGMGLGALAAQATTVVGLDYTQPVLDVARAHYRRRLPLICGDAQTLPFSTACFDLVVNFEAIYYLADPLQFLWEARRVLAPNGMLLLCTSNPQWPHFVSGALTTHYPDLSELDTWLAQCGFMERTYFGAFPATERGGLKQIIAPLRKLILQRGVVDPEGPLGVLLKRFAYGTLTPLPAELPSTHPADDGAIPTLTPLLSQSVDTAAIPPDTLHRVLYVLARHE